MSDLFDVLVGGRAGQGVGAGGRHAEPHHRAVGEEILDRPGGVCRRAERVGGAAREGGRQGRGRAARVGQAAAELSDQAPLAIARAAALQAAGDGPAAYAALSAAAAKTPSDELLAALAADRPGGGEDAGGDRRGSLAAARGGGEAGAGVHPARLSGSQERLARRLSRQGRAAQLLVPLLRTVPRRVPDAAARARQVQGSRVRDPVAERAAGREARS